MKLPMFDSGNPMCPFVSTAHVMAKPGMKKSVIETGAPSDIEIELITTNSGFVPCFRDQCAIWDQKRECCSVLHLSKLIDIRNLADLGVQQLTASRDCLKEFMTKFAGFSNYLREKGNTLISHLTGETA